MVLKGRQSVRSLCTAAKMHRYGGGGGSGAAVDSGKPHDPNQQKKILCLATRSDRNQAQPQLHCGKGMSFADGRAWPT